MRLIDADKFIETAWKKLDMNDSYLPVDIKEHVLDKMPTVDAVPIDWIEEWCLSQDLEYVRIAIKKMMDNWNGERKEE